MTDGLDGVGLHLVQTLDDANRFMTWLGERRPVMGIDTETTGLDPYAKNAAIRMIQFGDAQNGWAVPFKQWYGLAHEALKEYDGDVVFHNSAFEMRWLAHHAEWMPSRYHLNDTMLMAHIINPLGSGALKTLAREHVDPRSSAGQQLLQESFGKNGWDWATVPVDFQPYWAYSALDTVLTARLYEKFNAKCGPGGVYSEAYDLEMAVRWVISRMEHTGALIDRAYSQEKYEKLSHYAELIREWAKNRHGILLSSPSQVGKRARELGGHITQLTPSGLPRVDKYQLEIFTYHENPELVELATQALELRKADKIGSTYFRHFVEDADENDVIHADIRTLGARTGRMSIGSPALQQLPKGEAMVRNAFVARENHAIITSDFNQIEMRLFAHLSKDEDLMMAFRNADASGGDFFVEIGKNLYGDPSFSKKDKRRGLVKSVAYGLAYGAGLSKTAETAGVPESQMAPVYNGLIARYPGIKRFMNEVIDQGKRREVDEGMGYIELDDGRRLMCDPGFQYKLTNYAIQGSAALIFKRGLVRLDMAGYGDAMILPVHDEIVLDIPAEEAEDAINDVPKILTDHDYDIPLTADAEGPFERWGKKYE